MPQFRQVGIQRHRGGLGDVVMAAGVAERYAKEQGIQVTFGCPRELVPLCENIPGIEALPCRPTDDPTATPGAFDRITFGRLWNIADDKTCFIYEQALQPNVDRNRTEIWAQKMGIRGRIRPRLCLTRQERAWGRHWVVEQELAGHFLLGVVPKSASWGRDWRNWVKCLYRVKRGHPRIFPLFFSIGVQSWEEIELATIGIPIIRRPLREMLAILAQCHLVAGVDTGPMHAAAALGRPTLWIFTHIDGAIRTRGYKRVRVIQRTDLPCNPCWYEPLCHPPHHMLCKGIDVGQVARYIKRQYLKWRLRELCSLSAFKTAPSQRSLSSAIGITSPTIAP